MSDIAELRIAIVDNEPLFLSILKKMSIKLLSSSSCRYTIHTYESGEGLLAALTTSNSYDLYFLDILLDGMNGMELARHIRDISSDAKLVFITSSSEYAVESYEVAPLHYLVKPVTIVTLEEAFRRFFEVYGEDCLKKEETVLLKDTLNQKVVLPLSDIYYAEIMESRITVHTRTGSFVCRGRMDDLQKLLPTDQFYRCHRSFLVNFQHVSGIRRYDFILKNEVYVPVAKGCFKEASLAFSEYLER